MHVVVAGGGFAGMVAARRLAAAGAVVELLETRDEVGGRVGSREVDGFTLDRGFQVLFTAYPALEHEVDLDAIELRRFPPAVTIARPNHRSTLADPLRKPSTAVETLLNRDVGLRDKIRLLQLRRELRRRDPKMIFDPVAVGVTETASDENATWDPDAEGNWDDAGEADENGDADAAGNGDDANGKADDDADDDANADDGANGDVDPVAAENGSGDDNTGDESGDESGEESGDADSVDGPPDDTEAGRADGDTGAGPATVREYLDQREFSEAFVERFAEPFVGGLTLDRSLSTSSRVFEYTFKMILDGHAVVPAEGMRAIATHLRERARVTGATIRTAKAVTHIEVDGDSVTVEAENEEIFPGAVVVATDPASASDLTGVETPTDGRGCTTVHCSIPDHQSLDTGRRIVLNAEDARPNFVAPMSAVAPEYAPEGKQLLSAMYVGEQDEDDEALGEEVRDALAAWFPENHFGDLEVVAVDRHPYAQMRQPPGFRSSLPAVDDPEGPVYLAGDYTQWSSFQGALESGRLAAEAVLEDLE